ncbi:hypothetical protein BAE44_0002369 [Dichanthelium oligosanthes]|uniref:Uncharacterized protein n=1 Tax=Dichanthelium oligosanthes TaxID=888268 RepID=A0A1E5WHI0_9POAL|nr:hypothetical protein BAE44_0002369 [Dichanthelium oligosanthes]
MQASVAVAEALEAGSLTPPPAAGGADFAAAALAAAIAALSVAASFVLVSFDARARQGRLRRVLDLGPSLRGPRLLLAFFAGLLAAAEAFRLPFFRGAVLPPRRHVMPCLAYPLVAHGIAEPGMLACVLLLLRSSVGGAWLPESALAVPLACLPFVTAHVLVLATPATVVAYPGQLANATDGVGHCAYPAYAATLLLVLVAVYMPLLATACWDVAAVAINRRLRARAYALVTFVVMPLPVQVLALALTSVWDIHQYTSPTVGLVGFLAVAVAAEATLVILVMLPVHDALVLVEQVPVATAGEDAHDLAR